MENDFMKAMEDARARILEAYEEAEKRVRHPSGVLRSIHTYIVASLVSMDIYTVSDIDILAGPSVDPFSE